MTVLYLTSDRVGDGEPELGRRLLGLFLDKLVASAVQVDFVVCLNRAVFLTTEAGPPLESLRSLAASGAVVMTCGTCLEHHGRKESLLLGTVAGMQQTVELLASADRVIAPC